MWKLLFGFRAFFILILFGYCAHASAESPPNIVLILSDDQAWTDYGFMGHPDIQTPNLDQLAKQSVLFRRGYVPSPVCRPSLATIITGQYAYQHHISGNDPSPKHVQQGSELYRKRRAELISNIDRCKTLPELLKQRGYLSFQSGKWWEGNFKRGGFTHGMTRGFPSPGGRHGDIGLRIGREGLQPIFDFIEMTEKKEKPFLVWYAPFLPHSPHNPPERILKKYRNAKRPESIAKYYAMCEWFDETCGELIDYLDEKKLRENTLIVYVADNGWIQDPKSPRFAPRSKLTVHEGGIRTPIMFSWPKKLKPSDRKELVSSIDLFPTLLAAANIKNLKPVPGLNLFSNLVDGKEISRQTIFGEAYAHDIADIQNPETSLLFRWCIEGNWKLILTYDGEVNRSQKAYPRKDKRPQLYDLENDPKEESNLAAKHPEIVTKLAQQIEQWYPVKERKTLTKFVP